MAEETQRKLAAILAADVVGYSRLMEADEAGTLATMKAHRAELWEPLTKLHSGRVVFADRSTRYWQVGNHGLRFRR